MDTKDYFRFLVEDAHSSVFATSDKNGNPITCVIDMMLYDEKGIYFLTAKGKSFYDRLINNNNVSLSAMKGVDTMSTKAITINGKVKCIGQDKMHDIFEKNRYMYDIYEKDSNRSMIRVFQIYQGTGEFVDMTTKPLTKYTFSFGGEDVRKIGYGINDNCVICGECQHACTFTAIIEVDGKLIINPSTCFACGYCYSICKHDAIDKYE